jgi:hypothetical protein
MPVSTDDILLPTPGLEVRPAWDQRSWSCSGRILLYREDLNHFRIHCGFDISAMIRNIPKNGKEYQIACPKCGNLITVQRT